MSEFNTRPASSSESDSPWDSLADLLDLTPPAYGGNAEKQPLPSLIPDADNLANTPIETGADAVEVRTEEISSADLTEDQLGIISNLENSLRDILNDPRTKEALDRQRVTASSIDLAIEEMQRDVSRLAEGVRYGQAIPTGEISRIQESVGGFGRLIALDEEGASEVRRRFSNMGDVASEAWVSAKSRFGDEEMVLEYFKPKFEEIHRLSADLSRLTHEREGVVGDELKQKVNQLYMLLGELSTAPGDISEAARLMVNLTNDAVAIGRRSRELLGQIDGQAEAMFSGVNR